mgnify:FL=1
MKKFLISTAIVGLALGCASVQAISESIERGYISVNTSANAELAPDVAEISIAVKTYDNKSMQKATLQNKEISEQVISTLKSMIDTSKGDYIKTADFSATPIYSYSGNKRNFDKYQVSNSVVVHTKSIDKIGTMIDKAIALGATDVNSLNFSVSNYETQCNDLLTLAAKKASARANAVAKTVPTTLSGIRSMDVSCSTSNSSRPQYKMLMANRAMMMDSEAAGSSTTIESGVIKVFANVSATYFVK